MKVSRWLLAGLLVLMACSKITVPIHVHGIPPISPTAEGSPPVVKTLQPTFRWEPVTEPDAQYDFVIFERYGFRRYGLKDVLGRKVYYREGLQEPEHTLEVSLQPDREYFWSVRMRRGEEISEWSRFDSEELELVPVGYGCATRRVTWEYPFFTFRTPDK